MKRETSFHVECVQSESFILQFCEVKLNSLPNFSLSFLSFLPPPRVVLLLRSVSLSPSFLFCLSCYFTVSQSFRRQMEHWRKKGKKRIGRRENRSSRSHLQAGGEIFEESEYKEEVLECSLIVVVHRFLTLSRHTYVSKNILWKNELKVRKKDEGKKEMWKTMVSKGGTSGGGIGYNQRLHWQFFSSSPSLSLSLSFSESLHLFSSHNYPPLPFLLHALKSYTDTVKRRSVSVYVLNELVERFLPWRKREINEQRNYEWVCMKNDIEKTFIKRVTEGERERGRERERERERGRE